MPYIQKDTDDLADSTLSPEAEMLLLGVSECLGHFG